MIVISALQKKSDVNVDEFDEDTAERTSVLPAVPTSSGEQTAAPQAEPPPQPSAVQPGQNNGIDAWARQYAELSVSGRKREAEEMLNRLRNGGSSPQITTSTGKTVKFVDYVKSMLSARNPGADVDSLSMGVIGELLAQYASDTAASMTYVEKSREWKPRTPLSFSGFVKRFFSKDIPAGKTLAKLKRGIVNDDGTVFSYDFVQKKYPMPENGTPAEHSRTEAQRALESYKWKNWEYLDEDPAKMAALKKNPNSVQIGKPGAPGAPVSRVYEAAVAFNNAYKTISAFQYAMSIERRQRAIASGQTPPEALPRLPLMEIKPEEGKSADGQTIQELKKSWQMHGAYDALRQYNFVNKQKQTVDYTHLSKYWIMSRVIGDAIQTQENGRGAYPPGRLLMDINSWAKQHGYPQVPSLNALDWGPGGKYWLSSEMVNPAHEAVSLGAFEKAIGHVSKGQKPQEDSDQRETAGHVQNAAPVLSDPMNLLGSPFDIGGMTKGRKEFFFDPLMKALLTEWYKHEFRSQGEKQATALAQRAVFLYGMKQNGVNAEQAAIELARAANPAFDRMDPKEQQALVGKEMAATAPLFERLDSDIASIKEMYKEMNAPRLVNYSKDAASRAAVEQMRMKAFLNETKDLDLFYAGRMRKFEAQKNHKAAEEYAMRKQVNDIIRNKLKINYLANKGVEKLLPAAEIEEYMRTHRASFNDALSAMSVKHKLTIPTWLRAWAKGHTEPPTFEDMLRENEARKETGAYNARLVADENIRQIEVLMHDPYFQRRTAYEQEAKRNLTPKERLAKLVYDTSSEIITHMFAKEIGRRTDATASSFGDYVRMIRTARFLIIEQIRKAA